jgi:hypothetical protein
LNKSTSRRIWISEHWVFPENRRAYKVPGHWQKRPTKKTLRLAAKKRAATIAKKKNARFITLGTSEDRYRLYWTWKVLALVPPGYLARTIAHEDPTENEDDRIKQYMHTPFVKTKKEARLALRKLMSATQAKWGDVEWITFTLYRVGGPGPITEKHWRAETTYTDATELPKR